MQSAAYTHVGLVREVNEDSIIALPEAGIWAVADGMGGHEGGALASQTAVAAIKAIPSRNRLRDAVNATEDALMEAHEELRQRAVSDFDGRTIGTTIVALIVRQMVGVCLWAGDSRLYEFSDGRLSQLTTDHDLFNERRAQGGEPNSRNEVHRNAITRALGAPQPLFLDAIAFQIREGARYLLCSDGLYKDVSNDEISVGLSETTLDRSGRALMNACLANGARDNTSVIVTEYGGV
ncbi:MAG: protein phosphatase 2C domain-containing protein [Pseudomonadota bacterium]